MRHGRLVWLLAIVGLLAGCGAPPTAPPLDLPTSLPPTAAPTPVLGVPEAEPLSRYHLDLRFDPTTGQIAGQQQVTFPNTTGVALDEIVFRLYPNLPQYGGQMGIGAVWVDGQRASTSLRAADTALVVPLPRPLAPGNRASVELLFSVQIPRKESGYVLFGYSQGIWSAPDAYPLLAVHDGSVWREDLAPAHGDAVFAEAALYDVTLTLPPTLTLVATGELLADTPNAKGQRVYRLTGGPLREFAWLASADYRIAETVASGARLRSYYLPGDEAAGEAALHIAAAALRAYQAAFGPYPFAEMAIAGAPLQFYGMEFSGLNLIGLDLYREHRAELENRVIHEIAHQWWYAQVGNDQINTPWLDEGLAEYSMAIYYREVFGEARMNTLINQRWLAPYQVAIDNNYDAVVNQPAAAFSWEYEVIVYAKAALFFDALRREVGDEPFNAILREYASRYRWRIATPDGFLRVAESVSGRDLAALYTDWILSKR